MKVIYVAGPYRACCEHEVYLNIHEAGELARKVWLLGAVAICPHKNTAFYGGNVDDRVWLDGDLEMIRRCDAMLMMPGWERSTGAKAERELAESLGQPVFEELHELVKWLAQWNLATSTSSAPSPSPEPSPTCTAAGGASCSGS
ncbi:MAG TPA: DUF1937 family protein [Phycisphaerae bacterium]|nr:DUF1937 family protein [Phycisphaerae bacterium]